MRKGNDEKKPYLTIEEAAKYLRVSEAAIRVRVHRGQMTAYKPGRRLLFNKKELDRLLEKSRVGYEYGY